MVALTGKPQEDIKILVDECKTLLFEIDGCMECIMWDVDDESVHSWNQDMSNDHETAVNKLEELLIDIKDMIMEVA